MTTAPEEELYYQCQRCGNCCRWPGDVWLTSADIEAISSFLDLSQEDFIASFARLTRNRKGLSLEETPDGACVFLDGIDCTIQAVKPEQCRGFPNRWRFPGWEKVCEAIPIRLRDEEQRPISPPPPSSDR